MLSNRLGTLRTASSALQVGKRREKLAWSLVCKCAAFGEGVKEMERE